MVIFIIGLIAFLGLHSVRAVAEPWRLRQIAALGPWRWKILYSAFSIPAFALLLWGYSRARAQSPVVWSPPFELRYATALLVLVAFVLVVAAYLPGTRMRQSLGHPMMLGVKTWAFAHLLAVGTLAGMLLSGSFLVWSVVVYAAARRRDRAAGLVQPAGRWSRDALALLLGVAAWYVFLHWLHESWIGVRPFG